MLTNFPGAPPSYSHAPAKLFVVPLMMVEYTLKKFLQNSAAFKEFQSTLRVLFATDSEFVYTYKIKTKSFRKPINILKYSSSKNHNKKMVNFSGLQKAAFKNVIIVSFLFSLQEKILAEV